MTDKCRSEFEKWSNCSVAEINLGSTAHAQWIAWQAAYTRANKVESYTQIPYSAVARDMGNADKDKPEGELPDDDKVEWVKDNYWGSYEVFIDPIAIYDAIAKKPTHTALLEQCEIDLLSADLHKTMSGLLIEIDYNFSQYRTKNTLERKCFDVAAEALVRLERIRKAIKAQKAGV